MYYYQNFTLTFTGCSRCEIEVFLNEWIGELATEINPEIKKVSENMEFVVEK